MKNIVKKWGIIFCILLLPTISHGGILFQEFFEDTNFTSRGWYDTTATSSAISNTTFIEGSGSYECHWLQGKSGCNGGDPKRHKFTPTDTVFITYWIKHSSNWIGSGCNYHPHLIHFLTTVDGDYSGLARTHLTTYVEENRLKPLIEMQDGLNIDETKIGVNLTNVTENRANHGCNGIPDSSNADVNDCYSCGTGVHCNERWWISPSIAFTDSAGPYYKGDWHHIEAYFALNSIVSGKGVGDGKIRYWLDGQLLISKDNVMIRTGANPTMQFNQLIIAPYMKCGSGSPIDQSIWIDDLTVATSGISDTTKPSPPQNLRIIGP